MRAAIVVALDAVAGTPRTGAIVEALYRAGLAVRDAGAIRQPFLTPPGRFFPLNGDYLQLYEYPDEKSAVRETAAIAPDGGTHFFRSGNIVAIYVGRSEQTLALLRAHLGPPFAAR